MFDFEKKKERKKKKIQKFNSKRKSASSCQGDPRFSTYIGNIVRWWFQHFWNGWLWFDWSKFVEDQIGSFFFFFFAETRKKKRKIIFLRRATIFTLTSAFIFHASLIHAFYKESKSSPCPSAAATSSCPNSATNASIEASLHGPSFVNMATKSSISAQDNTFGCSACNCLSGSIQPPRSLFASHSSNSAYSDDIVDSSDDDDCTDDVIRSCASVQR